MSQLKQNIWVILPLFSILSMSPAQLESKQVSRQLASVVEEKDLKKQSLYPQFDVLTTKVDKSNIPEEVEVDKFLEKQAQLQVKISKEREDFKKNENDKEKVAEQRQKLEKIVSELVVYEEELKIVLDKKLVSEGIEKSIRDEILPHLKKETEGLLEDLIVNEVLVAKLQEPELKEVKKDEPEVLASVEVEPKKDVPALVASVEVEPKKDVPALVASVEVEPKKDVPAVKEVEKETKKDVVVAAVDKKEGPKAEVCAHDKNEVLTKPVEQLNMDQTLIMQQIMSMTQMMMVMLQQNQIYQMQMQFQNQGPVNQQAYQYAAPNGGGNWTYSPGPQQGMGMYPDQFAQPGYNGWGMQPHNYFEPDMRMNPMPLNPGQFGGPALGFNMEPSLNAPMGYGSQSFPI